MLNINDFISTLVLYIYAL